MTLSKNSLAILKLASQRESITYEDACLAIADEPYAAEYIEALSKTGLVLVHSEMNDEEGYERVNIRITPAGRAELESIIIEKREQRIALGLSIIATIISAIALLKP